MIFTDPNRSPTKSGLCDGDLFTGTVPKGAPALCRVDEVSWGCGKPMVRNYLLNAVANSATMSAERDAVPHLVIKSDALNWHEPLVRQDA